MTNVVTQTQIFAITACIHPDVLITFQFFIICLFVLTVRVSIQ